MAHCSVCGGEIDGWGQHLVGGSCGGSPTIAPEQPWDIHTVVSDDGVSRLLRKAVRAQRERDAQVCWDRAQELRRLPATEQVEPVYLALEACARAIRQGGDRGKQPDFADDPWMG